MVPTHEAGNDHGIQDCRRARQLPIHPNPVAIQVQRSAGRADREPDRPVGAAGEHLTANVRLVEAPASISTVRGLSVVTSRYRGNTTSSTVCVPGSNPVMAAHPAAGRTSRCRSSTRMANPSGSFSVPVVVTLTSRVPLGDDVVVSPHPARAQAITPATRNRFLTARTPGTPIPDCLRAPHRACRPMGSRPSRSSRPIGRRHKRLPSRRATRPPGNRHPCPQPAACRSHRRSRQTDH